MVIASIAANLLGALVFLFLFWKRLKYDYSSEMIFGAAFSVLAGMTIGLLLSLKIMPAGFFLFSFVGSLVGLGLSIFKLKMRFYETLEALVVSMLPWVSFVFLQDSVIHASLNSFIAFLGTLIFVFISYYLDLHYKNFSWYKSGKIGFTGVVILGLFFTTRVVLAIFKVGVISFVGLKLEIVVSGVIALISLLLLLNLSNVKK
jgi:hypothetical protein